MLIFFIKYLTDIQTLQVKLVSNKSGFNQIDKRWVEAYQDLWMNYQIKTKKHCLIF